MSLEPKMAKAHSRAQAERFIALGWRLGVECKADNGETYEWVLYWEHSSVAVRPALQGYKRS